MCILKHPKDLFFAFYAGNLKHHSRIAVQGTASEILAQESLVVIVSVPDNVSQRTSGGRHAI